MIAEPPILSCYCFCNFVVIENNKERTFASERVCIATSSYLSAREKKHLEMNTAIRSGFQSGQCFKLKDTSLLMAKSLETSL